VRRSDAGSQYTSIRYTSRLLEAGAVAAIGSDSYDNALAESLIALYKAECVRPNGAWRGVDELEFGTLNWVHWLNEVRLHSSPRLPFPRSSSRRSSRPRSTLVSSLCRENSASTEPGAVQ
jgi:hypothetical protein